MSYEVGTYIDLSGINKKPEVQKKTSQETARELYAVGTQFVFQWVEGKLQTARRIPVAYA